MKQRITLLMLVLAMVLPLQASMSFCALKWGFYAHRKINRLAVFTLPPDLIPFYKQHIEFITEHAVDPDKRRYVSEDEAPRHYIDIDHYAAKGEDPFKNMPRKWKDAVARFTEDTLEAYGIIPWHLDRLTFQLTKAFKNGDLNRILRYSSDLGHYIGDAHVPLHTTENYNGQLTDQEGIHGFWESRLPEIAADEYDFFVGKATYIKDPLDEAWATIEQSHRAVDSVLRMEAELTKEFPGDKKYVYENRGQVLVKTHSEEFSRAYHKRLDGMVERRMRKAILSTGSFWYTAWVNAGQPDLSKISDQEISEELKKQIKEENRLFGKGKIKGRKHGH